MPKDVPKQSFVSACRVPRNLQTGSSTSYVVTTIGALSLGINLYGGVTPATGVCFSNGKTEIHADSGSGCVSDSYRPG